MQFRGAVFEYKERHPVLFGMLVTAACIALGTGSRAAIDPIVDGVPFMTFFPAVALATYLGGQYAGIATMLLGGLIAAHFCVSPLIIISRVFDRAGCRRTTPGDRRRRRWRMGSAASGLVATSRSLR